MKKYNNPLYMTRREFDEYTKNSKYCDKPYEYYRVYPLLNHKHQQELTIFLRTSKNPVKIMEKATNLLKEEINEVQPY